jgi:hypothetical protein
VLEGDDQANRWGSLMKTRPAGMDKIHGFAKSLSPFTGLKEVQVGQI